MDSAGLITCIEFLDDDIDNLEEALEPLLLCPLTETANKLPLLDKAQLYVLVTYAIESILFCQFFCHAKIRIIADVKKHTSD